MRKKELKKLILETGARLDSVSAAKVKGIVNHGPHEGERVEYDVTEAAHGAACALGWAYLTVSGKADVDDPEAIMETILDMYASFRAERELGGDE